MARATRRCGPPGSGAGRLDRHDSFKRVASVVGSWPLFHGWRQGAFQPILQTRFASEKGPDPLHLQARVTTKDDVDAIVLTCTPSKWAAKSVTLRRSRPRKDPNHSHTQPQGLYTVHGQR